MTVQEFYVSLGSDYDSVKARLVSEKLIMKLLGKYPADKNYGLLVEGVAEKDYDKIFGAAHTIKGLALNLGFDELQKAASAMSEAYKKHEYDKLEELFPAVEKAQGKVLDGLAQMDI